MLLFTLTLISFNFTASSLINQDLSGELSSYAFLERIRIMCILCTPPPIYRSTSRSTYRPKLDRCIGRHIGRVSVDMSAEMCRSTYRPMYQPGYVGRVMVDISTDYQQMSRSIYRPTLGRYADH